MSTRRGQAKYQNLESQILGIMFFPTCLINSIRYEHLCNILLRKFIKPQMQVERYIAQKMLTKEMLSNEKTCFRHMWTTKVQISLCIHPVWSARMCRLIWTFVVRYLDSRIPILAKSKISRLASLCSWVGWFVSHLVGNPEDRFSRDQAQMTIPSPV